MIFTSLFKKTKPELRDIEDFARYINGKVVDHYSADLPVCYLLPDKHNIVNKNINSIDKLIGKVGLDLIGIEGFDEEELNKEWLKRFINKLPNNANLDETDIMKKFKLSINSEYPILKYVYGSSPVTLIGLEDPELFRNSEIITDCMKMYLVGYNAILQKYQETLVKELRNPDQADEKSIKAFYHKHLCAQFDKHLKPLIEKLTIPDKLPYWGEGTENLIFVDETPFYKAAIKIKEKYVIAERSLKAVDLALVECKKRNKQQIGIQFGRAHISQIQDELKKKNISYITIES